MWDALQATGIRIDPAGARRLGGGGINEAWAVDSDTGPLFVKFNTADRHEMFLAEAEGLAELAATGAVRVPGVVATGVGARRAFLALEYIALERGDTAAAKKLGSALARLHSASGPAFGWHRDNTIGSTPQINTRHASWLEFFRRHRLGFQLDLAARAGAVRLARLGAQLDAQLERFFAGIEIRPSLLHGDLWGGNWGASDGEPVIFDPAVYYGDPESDIAMTTLFGGFPPEFYAAYRARRPDVAGGEQRRELYRLYHVLNHFNLFGGGYGRQAERMIRGLIDF